VRDPDQHDPDAREVVAYWSRGMVEGARSAGLVSRCRAPAWVYAVAARTAFPSPGGRLFSYEPKVVERALRAVLDVPGGVDAVRALVREGVPLRPYLISIGAIAESSDPDRGVER
jgi:hypothetical protein